MLTMDPPRCSSMRGSTARVHRNTLFSTTATLRSQVASSVARMSSPPPMAALLTRTSMRPYALSAVSTSRWASAARVTSMSTQTARPAVCTIWSTVSRPRVESRSATTTAAPSLAARNAMARPIPDPAPVTIATRSVSRILPPQDAAVDVQRRPGDIAGFVGCEEADRVRDVGGSAQASNRDVSHHSGEFLGRHRDTHRGLDLAWCHGVYGDTVWSEVPRQGLGEGDQATLRAGIGHRSAHATGLARDGGDVDDAPPTPLAHAASNGASIVKGAAEIHLQHMQPLFLGNLLERPPAGHSRVIDQHVNRPKRAGTGGHGRRDLVPVLYIGEAPHGFPPERMHLASDALEEVEVTPDQRRVGLSPGELERHGTADPTAGTGHQRHAAVEPQGSGHYCRPRLLSVRPGSAPVWR